MNRKPRKHQLQSMGFYGEAFGGGCFDLGVLQLKEGVGLYHEQQIADAFIAERQAFIPYLQSVLAAIGHQQGE